MPSLNVWEAVSGLSVLFKKSQRSLRESALSWTRLTLIDYEYALRPNVPRASLSRAGTYLMYEVRGVELQSGRRVVVSIYLTHLERKSPVPLK